MPKRSSKSKSQKDAQQSARSVSVAGAPEAALVETPQSQPEKNPAAVALGRLGGLKGGRARAEKLTAKRRSEIAKLAAARRWKRTRESE